MSGPTDKAIKCHFELGCGHCTSYNDPESRCDKGMVHVSKLPSSAFAKQEGGSHYTDCAIQPFEYSMANKLDPMQHTAIKYITRFRKKAGVADLRKAIHTIELLIEWEEQNAQSKSN